MQHARVGIYKVKPGTADEVIRRARDDLVRDFSNRQSFVAHGLIKTGDDGLIFLSVWNLAEQAEAAVQMATAWHQQVDEIDVVEDYVGEVAFFWERDAVGR